MSKSRNRQLAKQHARRQAERRAQQRRKSTAIGVAAVIGVLGLVVVFFAFIRGGDEPAPVASGPSGVTGVTGETGPAEPGELVGRVEPTAGPDEVACDAQKPESATNSRPQFSAPAEVLEEGKTYTATLQTSCGDIVIELLADQAPQTVNSFVFLAQERYFDGQRIHRIDTSIDVLQGGDPTGTGTGGPGYSIPDELSGGETYGPGTIAMANGGPNTGGSQFFIITGEDGHKLDANPAYTVFGRVIEGLDIAKLIQKLPIQDPSAGIAGQQPAQAVYIERVTIDSK